MSIFRILKLDMFQKEKLSMSSEMIDFIQILNKDIIFMILSDSIEKNIMQNY